MVITLLKKFIVLFVIVAFLTGCSVGAISIDDDINQENTAPTYVPRQNQEVFDPKLGEFETTIVDKAENRINNVELACKSINGKILAPGEEFSFNETVGQRTTDRGYKEASIIVDGHKESGVGGGICQVSSTVYQAALAAGLEILERHEHSKKVPYIAKGDDATISGKLDLRFKNDYDFPVKFEVATNGENVTVVVYKDIANT